MSSTTLKNKKGMCFNIENSQWIFIFKNGNNTLMNEITGNFFSWDIHDVEDSTCLGCWAR